MNRAPREAVWLVLSELFVDTEHTQKNLYAIGSLLQETGFSIDEIATILYREVAPVCGRWMLYPGAIGPWPAFEEQDLKKRIQAHLQKPWYEPPLLHRGLMFMPGVRRDWKIIQNAMLGKPMLK